MAIFFRVVLSVILVILAILFSFALLYSLSVVVDYNYYLLNILIIVLASIFSLIYNIVGIRLLLKKIRSRVSTFVKVLFWTVLLNFYSIGFFIFRLIRDYETKISFTGEVREKAVVYLFLMGGFFLIFIWTIAMMFQTRKLVRSFEATLKTSDSDLNTFGEKIVDQNFE